ncbi:5-(carboxyamino)imidazole ribonucleotide synthase [Parendozoicomonas haliclonae]|uniref:N5-carboxyaminoimidazole ribonucleotide synthase n=1 Tax=Parendozoicomonas haliclonae TaxID=1960125 RepID=A0A1X7ANV8_9GAMM|nr:5-(carboxyamino)imidazole ribonucleotide synthase [Parendozoicomonas haliclonae]SMA49788.1 N5-carboxyaminoimidazole ribonucleotide synthase [Parendozoicomonas haliclonae]
MRVAIMGCGQLSRMLALSGMPMGIEFSFLAEPQESTVCIHGYGDVVRITEEQTPEQLFEALGRPDVITVERESVNVPLLRELKTYCPVYPDPDIVWAIQNRHREKTLVSDSGIPLSPWSRLQNNDPLQPAVDAIGGLPVVIKSTEDGYDGYNQWVADTEADLAHFETERARLLQEYAEQGKGINEWIVEKKIPFDREISVVGARNANGEVVFYMPGENRHQNGILKTSIVPAPGISDALVAKAEQYITQLLEKTGYVGVLAVELFVVGDELMVNELAPRVHNSGHWSMDGAETCQFENHVRGITNLPLGKTNLKGVAGMVNLLGLELSDDSSAPLQLVQPWAHLHWYGKTPRPGRKLGHVNIVSDDLPQLMDWIAQTEAAYS